jgi:hypothetical membrane protein
MRPAVKPVLGDRSMGANGLHTPPACNNLTGEPSTRPGRKLRLASLSNSCLLIIACICAPVLFLLAASVIGKVQDGYDPIRDTISQLALGSYGWLQTSVFIVFGLLLLVLAQRLYQAIKRNINVKIAVSLLVAVAFGLVLVGIFPTDPPDVLDRTVRGLLHGTAAYGVTLLFPFISLLFAVGMKNDPRWKVFYRYSLAAGGLGIVLPILNVVVPDISLSCGLYERLVALNGFAWLEAVSIRVFLLCLRREICPQ